MWPQEIFLQFFNSNFWTFSYIFQASVSQSLWFGYHNLNRHDANFGHRWWHQKWNKGQCLSRPNASCMGAKVTTTQKSFQMDDGNPPPLLDNTETGWFQTKNILNWEWIRVQWLLCSLWYKHTFSYFMLFTSHHHDITLKFTFSSWCQNSETEGKYKNLHCTLTLISSIKMHSIQLMTWISELLLQ